MINKKIKNISKIMIVSFLLSFIWVNNPSVYATNYEYNLNQEYIKSLEGNECDYFFSSNTTNGGGIVAVGETYSTNISGITNLGECDALIVKYDKDGNRQWIKSFGGNDEDCFNYVIETDDESFIAVGETYSTNISGITNLGERDALIVKYDKDGNQQWVKSFGGNDEDWFDHIILTNDNEFIITGQSYSTNIAGIINNGSADALISKYDKNGNQQWVKSFGGNGSDWLNSIIQTNDDGYIITGETYSSNINGISINGMSEAFIVKYDKNFNISWVKSFGGNNYDEFYSLIETNDNGFAVAGGTYSTNIQGITCKGGKDALIVKYDENGNQQWVKSFGGNDYDYFRSLLQTMDNGFIVYGSTSSTNVENINKVNYEDAIIVKYDENGNQQWIKSFGGNDYDWFQSMSQVKDGFVFSGYTYSTDVDGINNNDTYNSTAFIVKYTETKTIIPEETSSTLNVEIVTDNSLELSMSTNKISFEGYNGVEDLNNDKLNLTVSSGLYYDLYVTLDSEIRGTNDTNAIIDKANLKIKTSDDLEYKSFANIGEKVNIVSNHKNGRDFVHNINLKLLKDSSVKADTYNTNITFEVVQK